VTDGTSSSSTQHVLQPLRVSDWLNWRQISCVCYNVTLLC